LVKLTSRIFCSLLAVYSVLLLWTEWRTSQDHVRQYFSDIEGEVLFHAVNTSLSASLLAGAGLLLAFAALAQRRGGAKAGRPFLLTQAAMFGLFAFDDRFQLHERLGYRLGVPDHYVMLVWAVAELILLGLYCRPEHVTRRMVILFVAGTAWFAVMLFIDAVVPHDLVLRLSAEDLAKAWGAAMFFWFGWEAARFHLLGEGGPIRLQPSAEDQHAAPSMSLNRGSS
jgi:hypothetical protein